MKRLLFLFLAAVFIVGCSTTASKIKRKNYKIVSAEKELEVYSRLFEQYAAAYDIQVNMRAVRLYFVTGISKKTLGLCSYRDGKRKIYINTQHWKKLSDMDREALMMHEFGHCVLGLHHNSSRFSDGTPISLMHPFETNGDYYGEYRINYLDQMFKEFIQRNSLNILIDPNKVYRDELK